MQSMIDCGAQCSFAQMPGGVTRHFRSVDLSPSHGGFLSLFVRVSNSRTISLSLGRKTLSDNEMRLARQAYKKRQNSP
jgi:hypothetical protein